MTPEELPITFSTIEIDDGWTIGDLQSLHDCDEAFAVLMAATARIEGQLDIADASLEDNDPVWYASAKAALRFKKAALQAVNIKRSRFSKAEKAAARECFAETFIDVARDRLPAEMFRDVVDATEARQRGKE